MKKHSFFKLRKSFPTPDLVIKIMSCSNRRAQLIEGFIRHNRRLTEEIRQQAWKYVRLRRVFESFAGSSEQFSELEAFPANVVLLWAGEFLTFGYLHLVKPASVSAKSWRHLLMGPTKTSETEYSTYKICRIGRSIVWTTPAIWKKFWPNRQSGRQFTYFITIILKKQGIRSESGKCCRTEMINQKTIVDLNADSILVTDDGDQLIPNQLYKDIRYFWYLHLICLRRSNRRIHFFRSTVVRAPPKVSFLESYPVTSRTCTWAWTVRAIFQCYTSGI